MKEVIAMASSRTKWHRRVLHKYCQFLFKRCPDGNFHWWFHQVCWCRVGEHSDDWKGGIYCFMTDQELHDQANLNVLLEDAKVASYIAGRESCEKVYAVSGGIGTGKTHKAIEWVKQTPNGLIVTMSPEESTRLCLLYQLAPKQVTTWSMLERLRLGGCHYKLFWDNLDLYIQTVSRRYGCELGGWSATVAKAVDLDKPDVDELGDGDTAAFKW